MLADCPGNQISGNGLKVDSKKKCQKICDAMPSCTHAVYGGTGGKTGSSSDWWAMRCVPRSNFKRNECNYDQTWMRTYVKRNIGNN